MNYKQMILNHQKETESGGRNPYPYVVGLIEAAAYNNDLSPKNRVRDIQSIIKTLDEVLNNK